jgi:hypothetical protein
MAGLYCQELSAFRGFTALIEPPPQLPAKLDLLPIRVIRLGESYT